MRCKAILICSKKDIINEGNINQYVYDRLRKYNENVQVEPYIIESKEDALKLKEKYKNREISVLGQPNNNDDDILILKKKVSEITYEEFVHYVMHGALDSKGNVVSILNPSAKFDNLRPLEIIKIANVNFYKMHKCIFNKKDTNLFLNDLIDKDNNWYSCDESYDKSKYRLRYFNLLRKCNKQDKFITITYHY